MVTEQEYFNQYVKESDVHTDSINFKKKLSSKQWMVLWQECQLISDEKTAIGFWFKIKALFKCIIVRSRRSCLQKLQILKSI